MFLLIIGAVLAILVYVPSFWVRRVMSSNSGEISTLPGTGAELAKHLIERFELDGITVEETNPYQDHFNPRDPTVATHEVGHAIQFHRREKIFELRKRYLPTAQALSKVGVAIMFAFPIVGFIVRSPIVIGLVIALSLLLQLAGALAYLIILPEEWDASFNKALPILIEGDYVDESAIPTVRKILKAAALTYFSAALANVLNIGRWFMILRR